MKNKIIIGIISFVIVITITSLSFANSDTDLAGTISSLPQWKPTSTPFTAITTRTYGEDIYIAGNTTSTKVITASEFCLINPYDCITNWSISSGNATTTGSHYIGGDLTVNGSTNVQNITLVNQTISGNATTTGYASIGSAMSGFTYANGYLNVQNGLFANSATTTDTLIVGGKLTAVNGLFSTASTTIAANATTTGNFTANDVLYVKDGNIGIGIQNPSKKLYVSGNTYLSGSATTTGSFYFPSGVITESGNVGIGTTGPGASLQIGSGTPTHSPVLYSVGVIESTGNIWIRKSLPALNLISGGTSPDGYFRYDGSGGMEIGAYGGIIRFTKSANGTEPMRITGGNVGIGTVTPGARLNASSTTEQLRLSYDDVNNKYASFKVLAGGDLKIQPASSATTTVIGSGLKVEGNATTTNSLTVGSLLNCDTIDTDANGLFKCGTDATGAGGTGSNWDWGVASAFIKPSTTVGIIISASSTFIGDFRIDGNATSTNHLAAIEFLQNGISLANTYQPLEATLTDIADGTIAEDLVNTANPWADNEVSDTLTASWDLLTFKPATSSTLNLLDTQYRIANLNATSTRFDSATTTQSFYVGSGRIRDISNKSLTIASSTLAYINGGTTSTIQFINGEYVETWTKVACATDTGTATIVISDGTNIAGYLECSNTAANKTLSTNNQFTAFESIQIGVGNRQTTPNFIMISVTRRYD